MLLAIAIIVGVLILIGATQRKKLFTTFKATTNSWIDKAKDPIAILKLRISEINDKISTMVEKAAELFTQEKAVIRTLKSIEEKITAHKKLLAQYRGEKNDAKVQVEAKLILSLQKEFENVLAQLDIIKTNRVKIENLIDKQKSYKEKMKTRLVTVETNKATADVFKSVSEVVTEFKEDSLPNIEEEVMQDLDKQTKKLKYAEGEEEVVADVSEEEIEKLLKTEE